MKPVRILHPITRLIVGGAQENTLLTASLLNRDRFQVEILAGPQTGSEGSLINEVRAREIPLIILPELVRQINPWLDLRALSKMTRLLRSGQYTIVHTHSSKAGLLGRYAARQAGVSKIVHTVHGWSFHDYMSPLSNWLYIWLERWIATFTDAMIVVSQTDMEKGLRARVGRLEQYHLIRSAIPLEEFDSTRIDREAVRRELKIPLEATVIGSVCRLSPQKNPLDWMRIAGMVSREYSDVYFLLVGDGPLRKQVEILSIEEGIAERIVLTGIRRDIPRMLAAMDIFLVTSLWEGLPRTLPQAMRMNLPVIASQIDGAKEIIQHGVNGFLCPPKELAQMAIYCGFLVENSEERRRMGKAGCALATQEFQLPGMIHKIEVLYEKLLSEKT